MNDKVKISIYLTPESKKKLDELYIYNMRREEKKSFGAIISDGIGIQFDSIDKVKSEK